MANLYCDALLDVLHNVISYEQAFLLAGSATAEMCTARSVML